MMNLHKSYTLQTDRSAEHAAMFCPVGSNLQLRISEVCAPARLTMGDSSPLVRGTLRMRAFCLSAPEEMAIWFEGGELARARLMTLPPLAGDGEALRL